MRQPLHHPTHDGTPDASREAEDQHRDRSRRKRLTPIWLLVPPALLLLGLVLSPGCERIYDPELIATAATTQRSAGVSQTTGDAHRGRGLFAVYGCTACHTIPGIDGSEGLVGPPLTKFARRAYVAGVVKNTPYNLVRWIKDPPGVDPMTAMPNLHVTDVDARDMGAYLYTLR